MTFAASPFAATYSYKLRTVLMTETKVTFKHRSILKLV